MGVVVVERKGQISKGESFLFISILSDCLNYTICTYN